MKKTTAIIFLIISNFFFYSLVSTIQAKDVPVNKTHKYAIIFKAIEEEKWEIVKTLSSKIKDPLIRDFFTWVRLKSSKKQGKFQEFSKFIESRSSWPNQRTLRLNAEESIFSRVPETKIVDWFKKYPPITTTGEIRYAEALFRNQKTEEAKHMIKKIWINGNFAYRQERSFIKLYHKMWAMKDNITRVERLSWEGKISPARRTLNRIKNKDLKLLYEARFRLRAMRGGVDKAISDVPEYLLSNEGFLFERFRWRVRKSRKDAVDILENLPKNLSHKDLWWKEIHSLIRQEIKRKNFSKAYNIANKITFDNGLSLADSEWISGWIALRFLKKPERAIHHFQRMFENVTMPTSIARASYWAGRTQLALGNNETADTWFKKAGEHYTTFYGQLALAQSKKETTIEKPTTYSSNNTKYSANELIKIIDFLNSIGEKDHAEPFFVHFYDMAKSIDEKKFIITKARKMKIYYIVVKLGRNAVNQGINFSHLAYPVPELLKLKNKEEMALTLSVARQESNFYEKAISSASALGIMQILPSTAKKVSRNIGVKYSRSKLINDPSYNFKLGKSYLIELIALYENSYVLTLAGYNGGPGRVRKWIKNNGDPRKYNIDTIDWIELITISETRYYVQKVLANYFLYFKYFFPNTKIHQIKNRLRL